MNKTPTLQDLIDQYAEARHIHGDHTYNPVTAAARHAVLAALGALPDRAAFRRAYLVNTGEIRSGLELYERHDSPVPMSEYETVAPGAQHRLPEALQPEPMLQPDDAEALQRLDECLNDAQDYDVPKQAMQRLAELGAVQHHSAGRYSITTFGRMALGDYLYRFPLETASQCNDRLAVAATAAPAPISTPGAGIPKSPVGQWLITEASGKQYTVHRQSLAQRIALDTTVKVQALDALAPSIQDPPRVLDANALEALARERPDEKFLKGSGVLKLTGAIRKLERELRGLRTLATTQTTSSACDRSAQELLMLARAVLPLGSYDAGVWKDVCTLCDHIRDYIEAIPKAAGSGADGEFDLRAAITAALAYATYCRDGGDPQQRVHFDEVCNRLEAALAGPKTAVTAGTLLGTPVYDEVVPAPVRAIYNAYAREHNAQALATESQRSEGGPMRSAPAVGTDYFRLMPTGGWLHSWTGDPEDFSYLNNGLAFGDRKSLAAHQGAQHG